MPSISRALSPVPRKISLTCADCRSHFTKVVLGKFSEKRLVRTSLASKPATHSNPACQLANVKPPAPQNKSMTLGLVLVGIRI